MFLFICLIICLSHFSISLVFSWFGQWENNHHLLEERQHLSGFTFRLRWPKLVKTIFEFLLCLLHSESKYEYVIHVNHDSLEHFVSKSLLLPLITRRSWAVTWTLAMNWFSSGKESSQCPHPQLELDVTWIMRSILQTNMPPFSLSKTTCIQGRNMCLYASLLSNSRSAMFTQMISCSTGQMLISMICICPVEHDYLFCSDINDDDILFDTKIVQATHSSVRLHVELFIAHNYDDPSVIHFKELWTNDWCFV